MKLICAECAASIPKPEGRGRPPTYCALCAKKRTNARKAARARQRYATDRDYRARVLAAKAGVVRVEYDHGDPVEQAKKRAERHPHDMFPGTGLPCAECGYSAAPPLVRRQGRPQRYCAPCVRERAKDRKRAWARKNRRV